MPPDADGLAADDVARGSSELGLRLSAKQAEQMARFAALLVKWNRVYNLTTRVQPGEVLTHHLLDSLAVVPELAAVLPAGGRVLDVGAGGGLPGIPLAVAMPDVHFTLLDAVQKKVAFIEQARVELGLANVNAVQQRVEAYRAPAFDVVISRAFASLADMTRATAHLLGPGGIWLAMKGAYPAQEIDALAGTDVDVVRTVKLRVPSLDAERHLVFLRPSQLDARHL